jgi:SAM-dependent methyltransferase
MTDWSYHERQYETLYETTRALLSFCDDIAHPSPTTSFVDVACGGGANVSHMLRRWPHATVMGVDLDRELLAFAARRMPPELAPRMRLEEANLFELPERFGRDAFDVCTFMQTLLLFGPDEIERVIRSLAGVTKKWIFLSSLFTDKNMDVSARIRDYVRYGDDTKVEITYNILCQARFERLCRGLGVRDFVIRDFEIGIDLEGPPRGGLGTYTRRLDDGRRLQFSGAVYMPWKLVGLQLGG